MEKNNKSKDEIKFVESLSNYVLSKLSGEHLDCDEIIDKLPSKEIIVGNLCSYSRALGSISNPKKSSVNTNSLSISFLTKSLSNIKVKPSFFVYFKRENKTYKKYSVDFKESVLSSNSSETQINFSELNKKIMESEKIGEKNIPCWNGKIHFNATDYNQDGKKLKLITLTLENSSLDENKQIGQELSFFNTRLEISIEEDLVPFYFNYDYEGYGENYESDFQCINCSAEYFPTEKKIRTGIYKKAYQQSLKPKNNLITLEGDEFPLLMSELIEPDKRNKFLDKIYTEMNRYLEFYKKNKPSEDDLVFQKYNDSLNSFEKTLNRFKEGIDTIKNDKLASKAFELLQKTFEKASKYPAWRLFQLIFIISNIPDIIYKKETNYAEVLHVDTGGGKSEAYFGLIIFTSFFDRLRGKIFGITGITKFPLRMLSIQQLERVATIFIWAEEIRIAEKIEGHPFSVAYFVGNSLEFPRYNYQMIYDLTSKKIPGKIIRKCPICKKEEVFLSHNKKDGTVIHRCNSCNKDFFLYLTDEEVFRMLPTFIVATVDKFSGIAQNRRYRNLFGGNLCRCSQGHGFIPSGDVCEANEKRCESKETEVVSVTFNTGPSIIVQDEMHLIRESFGTIDSHFESFMETLQQDFQSEGFKNIAMTATISGAKDQIRELYCKETRVFPGSSPFGKGKNDFFFTLNEEESQRLLIGLKPNGEENRKAIRLTLEHILSFISEVESNKEDFCKKNNLQVNVLDELLTNYKSYLSYHSKKDDAQSLNNLYQYINEKDYHIKPIILTGDLSLDEIRDVILQVNKQDTLSTKEILNVCATSVVSHGVDIEKWNIMCFQGMPRSTAEYIQSLSRVGRQHLGLIFMWFYPNKIRDLSFFNKFEEYHKRIHHHVNPVPISRWARLGFYETFNSLFCATILNYFSNKFNKPLYKVSEVNSIFSSGKKIEENRKKLIEFIKKAYRLSEEDKGSKYFEENIDNEVEDRINLLTSYVGSNKDFFPGALSENNKVYYKNQSGMRGIQREVLLRPEIKDIDFISGFKTIMEGSKDE